MEATVVSLPQLDAESLVPVPYFSAARFFGTPWTHAGAARSSLPECSGCHNLLGEGGRMRSAAGFKLKSLFPSSFSRTDVEHARGW